LRSSGAQDQSKIVLPVGASPCQNYGEASTRRTGQFFSVSLRRVDERLGEDWGAAIAPRPSVGHTCPCSCGLCGEMGNESLVFFPAEPVQGPNRDGFIKELACFPEGQVAEGDIITDLQNDSPNLFADRTVEVVRAVVGREAALGDFPVDMILRVARSAVRSDGRIKILGDWFPVTNLQEIDGGERYELSVSVRDEHECGEIVEFINAVDSPSVREIWTRYTNMQVREGVSWSDDAVPSALTARLNSLIDKFAADIPTRYHPGSRDIVRDIVHPSWYPYIRDCSQVVGAIPSEDAERVDFWHRKYEDSIYQWLPSEVRVSNRGDCKFTSYINNLEQESSAALYSALEDLLRYALPHFERVYEYILALEFVSDSDESDLEDLEYEPRGGTGKLRGRTLQVVTKIVDYELAEGDSFEGVWHVEGMSHENIVATCLFIADRDSRLDGGELEFKRAFWNFEAVDLRFSVPQVRHMAVDDILNTGLLPLGRLQTPGGRLIVFPNSHVHRLSELTGCGRRRIVVFFLINPAKRIISTANVPPQQTVMSEAEALQHLENLMHQRKYHKQDWNVRDIDLCEH